MDTYNSFPAESQDRHISVGGVLDNLSNWLFDGATEKKTQEEVQNQEWVCHSPTKSLLPELDDFLGGSQLAELRKEHEELTRTNEALCQQVHTLQLVVTELHKTNPSHPLLQPPETNVEGGPTLPKPSSSLLPVVQLAELEALGTQVDQLQRELDEVKAENKTLKVGLQDSKDEAGSWYTQYSILVEKYQEASLKLEDLNIQEPETTDGPGMIMDVVEEDAPLPPGSLPPDEERVLREKIKELEQLLLKQGDKVKELEETLDRERDLHGSTAHGFQTEITELQTTLDGFEGQRESMGAVISKTQADLNEMTSKHEKLEAEHDNAKKELAAVLLERDQHKQSADQSKADHKETRAEALTAQQTIAQMKIEEAALQKKLEATETRLQQQELDSKAALRSSNQLVKQLQAELKKTAKDLNDLRIAVKIRLGDAEAVADAVDLSLTEQSSPKNNFPTEGEEDLVFISGPNSETSQTDEVGKEKSERSKDSALEQEPNFFQKLFKPRGKSAEEEMIPVTDSGKPKM